MSLTSTSQFRLDTSRRPTQPRIALAEIMAGVVIAAVMLGLGALAVVHPDIVLN